MWKKTSDRFPLWAHFWGPTTACCLGILTGNTSFGERTPSHQLFIVSFFFSKLTKVTPRKAQQRLRCSTVRALLTTSLNAEMSGEKLRTYQALPQLKCNLVTGARQKLYLIALSEIFTSSLWPSTEQPYKLKQRKKILKKNKNQPQQLPGYKHSISHLALPHTFLPFSLPNFFSAEHRSCEARLLRGAGDSLTD